MEIHALHKSANISARKVRLVADVLSNISVAKALQKLVLMRKRGGVFIEKTLNSAIANAVNNAKLNKDNLFIKRIEVTDGQALKRFHPSTRGRVHPYKRRRSNIRIILEEK